MEKENIFDQIKSIVKVYTQLVDLSKNRSFKEINLMNVFKNTKIFFEMFIKFGMPWFDQVFELSKNECIDNIKILQNTLLYLQDMSYKKAHLSKQIPQLMKLIESFQLRVKLMLYVNNCDNAFFASLHLGKLDNETKIKKKAVLKIKLNSKKNKKKNNNAEDDDKENFNEDEESNDPNTSEGGEEEEDNEEDDNEDGSEDDVSEGVNE